MNEKEIRQGFIENRKAGYNHGYSDGYNKAIEEFVVEAMKQLSELELADDFPTVADCKSILFEVVKSMKGEKE